MPKKEKTLLIEIEQIEKCIAMLQREANRKKELAKAKTTATGDANPSVFPVPTPVEPVTV